MEKEALKVVQMDGEQEAKAERDYTRDVYQNFMLVAEALEKASPLPMTKKEIQDVTCLSKSVVFDVCWNMVKRGWAIDVGGGNIVLKRGADEKHARIGRMMLRLVRDVYGVNLEEGKG